MNADSVKRIVALCRQASSYAAMARKGVLTKDEAALLIAQVNQEIAAVRAQDDLQLAPPPAAGGAPSKGAK